MLAGPPVEATGEHVGDDGDIEVLLVVKGGGLLPPPWQIGSPPPLLLRGHLHLVLVILLLLLLGARIKFELGLYKIIPYCQDY